MDSKRLADFDKALFLLRVIDGEFQSDPMSVQCFDLRIVAQVHELVEEYKSAQQ